MIAFTFGLLIGALITLLCVKYFRNKTESLSDKLGAVINKVRHPKS